MAVDLESYTAAVTASERRQDVCQPGARNNYPSVSNPARTNTYLTGSNGMAATPLNVHSSAVARAVSQNRQSKISRGRDRLWRGDPPHRSVRAGLLHTALTSDEWRQIARRAKGEGCEALESTVQQVETSSPNCTDDAGPDAEAHETSSVSFEFGSRYEHGGPLR